LWEGWLVGWWGVGLFRWWVGWVVGWVVGGLFGWLVVWLGVGLVRWWVGWLVGWVVGGLFGWLVVWLGVGLVRWWVGCLVGELVSCWWCWWVGWVVWLVGLLVGWVGGGCIEGGLVGGLVVRVKFFAPVQTGPGTHPSSYTEVTRSSPGVTQPGRSLLPACSGVNFLV
jgi:hypothetical protein